MQPTLAAPTQPTLAAPMQPTLAAPTQPTLTAPMQPQTVNTRCCPRALTRPVPQHNTIGALTRAKSSALNFFLLSPGRILMHHLREARHSRGTYGAYANLCSPLLTTHIFLFSTTPHQECEGTHHEWCAVGNKYCRWPRAHISAGLTKITKAKP